MKLRRAWNESGELNVLFHFNEFDLHGFIVNLFVAVLFISLKCHYTIFIFTMKHYIVFP